MSLLDRRPTLSRRGFLAAAALGVAAPFLGRGAEPLDPCLAGYDADHYHPVSGSRTSLDGQGYAPQAAAVPWALGVRTDGTRHELRAGDQWSGDVGKTVGPDRQRSELRGLDTWRLGEVLWIAFDLRLGGEIPDTWTVTGQLHQRPEQGEVAKPPVLSHVLEGDRLSLVVRGDRHAVTRQQPPPRLLWEGPRPRTGRWSSVVHRAVLDPQHGRLDTWLDGQRVVHETSFPFGYADVQGPSWKIGLYRQRSDARTVAEYRRVTVSYADLSRRIGPAENRC